MIFPLICAFKHGILCSMKRGGFLTDQHKFMENTVVFLFGGILYSLMEICFRGYTHWSMTLTGGFCLVVLYRHFRQNPLESMLTRCFFGMAVITAAEFLTGCVVNIMLDWNVWDYSSRPFNLFGQICPLFSALWFLLTIPACWLCRILLRHLSV